MISNKDDPLYRRLSPLALILAGALALAACNTAEGFGQDMQEGGEAIEEEAED